MLTAASSFGLLVVICLVCCAAVQPAAAWNYTLTVRNDDRRVIDLGVFGYADRGSLTIRVLQLSLLPDDEMKSVDEKIGFTLDMVPTASEARQERNYAKSLAKGPSEAKVCFIDDTQFVPMRRVSVPMEKDLAAAYEAANGGKTNDKKKKTAAPKKKKSSDDDEDAGESAPPPPPPAPTGTKEKPLFEYTRQVEQAGLYALFFYNCKRYEKESMDVQTTFMVIIEQYNVMADGSVSFLSVGDTYLPLMYLVFGVVFIVGLAAWHRVLGEYPERVHKIHTLMYVLGALKCLTLILDSVMLDHRKSSGAMRGLIDFLYYFFQTCKGIALFTVIVLLATGWSVVKPFLAERDKKILFAVVPLQVLANIALAVVEENSEGKASLDAYRKGLRLFEVACCCVVMIPIVWSLHTLGTTASGKGARDIARMKQFRSFYASVVVFVYFTRILVPLAESSVPYSFSWLPPFLYESAAFIFYAFLATSFRPQGKSFLRDDASELVDDGDVQLDDVAATGGGDDTAAAAAGHAAAGAPVVQVQKPERAPLISGAEPTGTSSAA